MDLFACDLDNTLIHSSKHKTDNDICIEIYNGKEQSFISRYTLNLLKKIIQKVLFVPITTRSIEQYNRIQWLEGTIPKIAVVSNGTNLIYNGKLDLDWRRDFYNFIKPYEDELQRKQAELSRNKNFSICRKVDESFLFLKCRDEVDTTEIANKIQSTTNLVVQHSGLKIYLFPPKLNKGEALLKLKNKFKPLKTFAAGDSSIDISMLNMADIAFAHVNLTDKFNNKKHFMFDSSNFEESLSKIHDLVLV